MSDKPNLSGKKTGGFLVRHALEQMPVSHTFGIPGVHNTEIYDELQNSKIIQPVLVTHEGGGAFMADAISRTSDGEIGVCVIVPAAGMTHALSGIGEAFLDGIPLLVITGGTRTDVEFVHQVHQMDQLKVVRGITKGAWKIEKHQDIVPTLYEAYRLAVSGTPGPVFVEIPVDLQVFLGDVQSVPAFEPYKPGPGAKPEQIAEAAKILADAKSPGIFVGWGAIDTTEEIEKIAELLGAPVSTTLQGMGAFLGNHPLHTGMGFGKAAVPASTKAFADCDAMLAVGTRFGEIPTASYGSVPPANLIHIDIDGRVLGSNFPAAVAIEGDSRIVVPQLLQELQRKDLKKEARREKLQKQIAEDKEKYRREWVKHATGKENVNPALFFDGLRKKMDDDALLVVDDGHHTFLTAELFEVRRNRGFISPSDFNCMGYCVPAAIGAKLVNPDKQVVGIVGDGAFIMTGLEMLTASTHSLGIVYFVFHDGTLSQIAQFQKLPYNRKTCTVIGDIKLKGVATATGAAYLPLDKNDQIESVIDQAFSLAAKGQPVIVDVSIDYTKQTRYTKGVSKTVAMRAPLGDIFRFVGRAAIRKITG